MATSKHGVVESALSPQRPRVLCSHLALMHTAGVFGVHFFSFSLHVSKEPNVRHFLVELGGWRKEERYLTNKVEEPKEQEQERRRKMQGDPPPQMGGPGGLAVLVLSECFCVIHRKMDTLGFWPWAQ